MENKMPNPDLTHRDIAQILAALRAWQVLNDRDDELVDQFPDHFDEYSPMDSDEIDDLCERLNLSA